MSLNLGLWDVFSWFGLRLCSLGRNQKWCILRASFLRASDTDWSYYWQCSHLLRWFLPWLNATMKLSFWWSWWAQNSWSSESLDGPGKHFLTVKASFLIPCKKMRPRTPAVPACRSLLSTAWLSSLDFGRESDGGPGSELHILSIQIL